MRGTSPTSAAFASLSWADVFTLYIVIRGRNHHWTTCGWVYRTRCARKYRESEAHTALNRMRRAGVDARMQKLSP